MVVNFEKNARAEASDLFDERGKIASCELAGCKYNVVDGALTLFTALIIIRIAVSAAFFGRLSYSFVGVSGSRGEALGEIEIARCIEKSS